MNYQLITILSLSISVSAWADLLPQKIVRNTSNEIDQFVAHALKRKNITANELIDDATFARRCYINISGRIPTIAEAKSFIDEKDPNKRALLIDYLIKSNGHKSQMFNFWADLLRIQTNKERAGLGWHVWVRDAVDSNMPYNQFVYEMLSASGSAVDNPAVGYYLRDRQMLLDNVSNTVQVFLGRQIGCAQCHDHPTEDMTQKEYYELAAFSSSNTYKNKSADQLVKNIIKEELGFKTQKQAQSSDAKALSGALKKEYGYLIRGKGIDKFAVPDDPTQTLKIPHDYQYNDAKPGDKVKPTVFFGQKIDTTNSAEHKQAFAHWVVASENPYFTKVIVNRLWAHVFGKGIVEPVDDWSETTTVPNPELLDYLSKVMVATKYDVREFLRVLYNTRLFASGVAVVEDNLGDSCDFKGPVLRRMNAEELHDSMLTIEHGNQDSTTSEELKGKWNQYVDEINNFLDLPTEKIVALKNISSEKRALQHDARNHNSLAKKARIEGDEAAANKHASMAKALTKKMKSVNKKASIEMSMDTSMSYGRGRSKSEGFVRASEKATPHKPSSFLMQFGASDRKTPEAAHTDANIPQALTLLNGDEIKGLAQSRSTLMKEVRKKTDPTKRLNALFLGIYGTYATEAEHAKFAPLVEDSDGLSKLAQAMMTSKRFLFVQ